MPIDVTELGMEIEVIPVHLSNAYSPIEVTVLGIIVLLHPEISVFVAVSIIALQLSRESYTGFAVSTIKELSFSQRTKAVGDKFIKVAGIVIVAKNDGVVSYVDADKIIIDKKNNSAIVEYGSF